MNFPQKKLSIVALSFILLGYVHATGVLAPTEEEQEPVAVKQEAMPIKDGPSLPKQRVVIDKIVVRVNGINILQSDLQTPRIAKEGGFLTLQEAIIEQLLYDRAASLHMLPSEQDIDRQLVSFKMQNNLNDLSDEEFEEQLKESGFTLKMYKRQLGILLAIENVKRVETSERVVVTSQEVEDYCAKHPDCTDDEYLLQICDLPKDGATDLETFLKTKSAKWKILVGLQKNHLVRSMRLLHRWQ